MGFVDDGEVEAVHRLPVQPLRASQSGLQRTAYLRPARDVLGILTVYE